MKIIRTPSKMRWYIGACRQREKGDVIKVGFRCHTAQCSNWGKIHKTARVVAINFYWTIGFISFFLLVILQYQMELKKMKDKCMSV